MLVRALTAKPKAESYRLFAYRIALTMRAQREGRKLGIGGCVLMLVVGTLIMKSKLFPYTSSRPYVNSTQPANIHLVTKPQLNLHLVTRPQLNTSAHARRGKNRTGTTFLHHRFTGRLGNVLFQYASVYCLAKQHNLKPIFPSVTEAAWIQDPEGAVVSGRVLAKLAPRQLQKRRGECSCCYERRLESSLSSHRNYTVFGYLQSWKYFEPCKQDVLRMVAFKSNYRLKADGVLAALRRRFPGKTLVGVHVRLEDFLSAKVRKRGFRVATGAYFRRAMQYFRDRFADVVFIVVTSSKMWWREHVARSPEVTFLPRSASPAVDMEVLSRLDHVIISVGTFGWWTAYKSNGSVVYFKDFYAARTHYGDQLRNDDKDYIYPGWVGL